MQINFEEIDYILYALTDGDLSKKKVIEDVDRDEAFNWYYKKRNEELNELRVRTAELEKHEKK